MPRKKPGRKRSRAGRPGRRRLRRGQIRPGEERPDLEPARQKILRGRANEGAPPPQASTSEVEGEVRDGVVVAIRGREAVVALDSTGQPVGCLLRKSTRVPHPGSNALAVGDRVRLLLEGEEPFVLTEVEARKTALRRTRRGDQVQVIAANVDACLIVGSCDQPPFKPRLVDRYLLAAAQGGLQPVLVLNKADLADPAEVDAMLAPYRGIGLVAVAVSATTGAGIDALAEAVRGKTSVLSGQSGVGKSSLLNALVPGLGLVTAGVYGKVGKGRHTTTASTLYRLANGGAVIDTPGLRSFLLPGGDADALQEFFPEVAVAAEGCRFSDCRHVGEDGCALPEAIRRGAVREDRLESYRTLRAEMESAA